MNRVGSTVLSHTVLIRAESETQIKRKEGDCLYYTLVQLYGLGLDFRRHLVSRAQSAIFHRVTMQHAAMHCNALQRTAIHCNTLQHAATHCNTLQRTATHCNTMQHNATQCNTLQLYNTHQ